MMVMMMMTMMMMVMVMTITMMVMIALKKKQSWQASRFLLLSFVIVIVSAIKSIIRSHVES